MDDVPNLINIYPTNPSQILNQYEFLWIHHACVLQIIFVTKIKNLDVGTRAPQQRQEVY